MTVEPASQRPGVSIVVTSYNYGPFVGEAIASALAQTWDPVEVIVVDDGSTDGSRSVIASFADRITAIFQDNAGHLAACLRGFDAARHDIVVFLDSDDVLLPEAAATIVANWRPGTARLQFQLETIDARGRSNGHIWPKFPASLDPATIRAELLRTGTYPSSPTSGNAFSRRLVEASRPPRGHDYAGRPLYADSLLTTTAPLYGEVRTLHRPLVRYRVHGANTWAQNMLVADRFAFYAASERLRVEVLADHCRRLGIAFAGPQVLERSLHYREIELARRKLEAGGRGHTFGLLAEGCRSLTAALAHPHGPWHKLLRAAWSLGVTLAPAAAARRLIAMRFVPAARPRLAERLITLFTRHRAPRAADSGRAATSRIARPVTGDPKTAWTGET